jgi:hypothetical protein
LTSPAQKSKPPNSGSYQAVLAGASIPLPTEASNLGGWLQTFFYIIGLMSFEDVSIKHHPESFLYLPNG